MVWGRWVKEAKEREVKARSRWIMVFKQKNGIEEVRLLESLTEKLKMTRGTKGVYFSGQNFQRM